MIMQLQQIVLLACVQCNPLNAAGLTYIHLVLRTATCLLYMAIASAMYRKQVAVLRTKSGNLSYSMHIMQHTITP